MILSAGQSTTGGKSSVPLYTIDKNKLIDLQIKEVRKASEEVDIIFGIGFESKKVIEHLHKRKARVKVIENFNYRSTSSAETLRLILNSMLPCDMFIIHGDRHFRFNSTVDLTEPTIFVDKQVKSKNSIGVSHQNGLLNNLSYGLETTWSEISFLPEYMFDEAKTLINKIRSNYNIADFINKLNDKKQFKVDNSIEINPI